MTLRQSSDPFHKIPDNKDFFALSFLSNVPEVLFVMRVVDLEVRKQQGVDFLLVRIFNESLCLPTQCPDGKVIES